MMEASLQFPEINRPIVVEVVQTLCQRDGNRTVIAE